MIRFIIYGAGAIGSILGAYLATQTRFRHLTPEQIEVIQSGIDRSK